MLGRARSAPILKGTHGLDDMPLPWIVGLLAVLKPEQRVSLMQTGTTLRDLVLAHCTMGLCFGMPIPPDQVVKAQAKLRLACNRAANIKLQLHAAQGVQASATGIEASGCSLLRSAAGQGQEGIRHVELRGLALNSLAASWLASTCPHMTSLQLSACHLNLAPTAPTCQQLKHLHLHITPAMAPTKQSLPFWQNNLQALIGLRSLTLISDDDSEVNVPRTFFSCCASAVGAQITHLTLAHDLLPDDTLPAQLGSMFPHVTELQMPHTQLDDLDMEPLFTMHSLRHLQCQGFDLQHSYSHRTWPLVCIRLDDLCIASSARLPLEGVQAFHVPYVPGARVHVYPSPDLEETTRVVAAMRHRLQWGRLDRLVLDYRDSLATNARQPCLSALTPLLPTSELYDFHLEWENELSQTEIQNAQQVTKSFLSVLCQYLAQTSVHDMYMNHCTFAPDACDDLLHVLPPSVSFMLFRGQSPFSGPSQAQVEVMCASARWPIVLLMHENICAHWQPDWFEHMEQVIAENDHNVDLMVFP